MTFASNRPSMLRWAVTACAPLLFAGLTGCGTDAQTAVSKADPKVYEAIDSRWPDAHGSRTDVGVDDPNHVRQTQIQAILDQMRRTESLDLEQAVRLAALNAPEYRTEVEAMYLTGLELLDAEHLYAVRPFAFGASAYQRSGSDETVESVAGAGLQQLLASGATVMADLTVGYVNVLTGDVRGGSSSIFRVGAIGPLLRGSDRKVVLETLTQAERNMLYAVRDFNRFRKTFAVAVTGDYYRLAELARRTIIAEENVRQLEEVYQRMEHLATIGRIERHELDQARQDILTAKDDRLDLQRRYAENLDRFKLRLHIPVHLELEPTPHEWLMAADELFDRDDWSEDKAVQTALAQRLDLANTQDQVADAERHVHIAEDALGADLAVFGTAAPAGGNAQSRYTLGLEGSLPLDRVTEAHTYKRALVALTAMERQYENHTYQITAEVRKAWRDMAEARDRYALQKDARQLARRRLETTLEMLHYRRADARDVLDAQQDLYDAETDFTAALTDYTIAQLNFLRDTETLWIEPDGTFFETGEAMFTAYPKIIF